VISNTSSADSDFKPGKSERLFRSAISAYCALVRPGRQDAAQLDDLTLPLLPLVSVEGRRYAAAALSEMGAPATMLVRRLAEEPVEISAPLLMRSTNLGDVDLIGLIGRHGIGHARAIGRRKSLNANIAKLIKALGAAEAASGEMEAMEADSAASSRPVGGHEGHQPALDRTLGAAEEVRVQLREMMLPAKAQAAQPAAPSASPIDWNAASAAYPKLLSTALTGSDTFFHTAIADALDISYGAAQMLGEDEAPSLTTLLKALDLPVEQAFLVAILVYPYAMVGHENVRGFVAGYRKLDVIEARRDVSAWRERDAGQRAMRLLDWEPAADAPANDIAAGDIRVLRAS
jgi:uncharacterized protein (DUF2336 family)